MSAGGQLEQPSDVKSSTSTGTSEGEGCGGFISVCWLLAVGVAGNSRPRNRSAGREYRAELRGNMVKSLACTTVALGVSHKADVPLFSSDGRVCST